MFGPFGIEQLEPARPRLQCVLPDRRRRRTLFDQPSVVCCASEHIDAMIVSAGRWHWITSASGYVANNASSANRWLGFFSTHRFSASFRPIS